MCFKCIFLGMWSTAFFRLSKGSLPQTSLRTNNLQDMQNFEFPSIIKHHADPKWYSERMLLAPTINAANYVNR
jgi:hypothetical protein